MQRLLTWLVDRLNAPLAASPTYRGQSIGWLDGAPTTPPPVPAPPVGIGPATAALPMVPSRTRAP